MEEGEKEAKYEALLSQLLKDIGFEAALHGRMRESRRRLEAMKIKYISGEAAAKATRLLYQIR